jgi:hypothetical protein
MVTATKEKAAFRGSERSEVLRAGVTRAQGRGGADVKSNWTVVPTAEMMVNCAKDLGTAGGEQRKEKEERRPTSRL